MMPWSVEQETMLFKSICRVKPVGPHKHFRMLTIHSMVNSPFIAGEQSISVKEIWDKLGLLYDLSGLDEIDNTDLLQGFIESDQENDEASEDSTSSSQEEENKSRWVEFQLPLEDLWEVVEQKAAAEDEEDSDHRVDDETHENSHETKADSVKVEEDEEMVSEHEEEPNVVAGRKRGRSQSLEVKSDSESESARPSRKSRRQKRSAPSSNAKPKPSPDETEQSEKEEVSTPRTNRRTPARSSRASSNKKAAVEEKKEVKEEAGPRRSSRRK